MPVLKDDLPHLRFGLLHHSHTGKRLHKSHTSYPLLAALLLMLGVLLTTATLQVRAADITVNAIANGSTSVQPAVILSPENDDHFTDSSIPVSGTCEAGYYIKLFRNNIFSGSTLCSVGGTFSITTDLFAGRNDLQARTFNVADNEGPASTIVTVYLDVPVIPEPEVPGETPSPEYQPGGRPVSESPFYLSTEYFFKAAYTGQKITWEFDIMGGNGPFTAYVVWGDGYSDVITNVKDNKLTIEHVYTTAKDKREYFSLSVRIVDKNGYSASLQLINIMNDPHVISGALVRPNDPSPLVSSKLFGGVLKLVWSAYGIVLLMGICFWLGERRGESITRSFYKRRRQA